MVTNDKSNINLEELASGLIDDISKISESAAGLKVPETMDDIDVSVFKMDSLKGLLNSTAVRIKAQAEETAARNKAQVDEVTETITSDLTARKAKFEADLKVLQDEVRSNSEKLTGQEKVETEVILKNISNRAVIINRNIDEVRVQKEMKMRFIQ